MSSEMKSTQNGDSIVEIIARLQTKNKMEEVYDGIQTFLRIAYLQKTGRLSDDFWGGELDTPTTIINVLSHSLLDFLKDSKPTSDLLIGLEGIESKKHIFLKIGQDWYVRYNSEEAILRDLERIRYIIHLLDKSNHEFTPPQLISLVKKSKLETKAEFKKVSEEELAKNGMGLHELEIAKLSESDKKNLQKIALENWSDLEVAKKSGNHQEVKKAKEDWDKVTSYLQEYGIQTKITRKGPKFIYRKQLEVDYEKARINVSRQITKALGDIEKHMHKLATHLKATIKKGYRSRYSLDPNSSGLA